MNKKEKIIFVASCIFSVLATIAMFFYIIFFFLTLDGVINNPPEGDLGAGLQMVFGLIFALIAGVCMLIFSVGVIFSSSLTLKNISERKQHTASKVFIITDVVYVAVALISFIVLLILV